jgi:hypothetical protein
MLVWMAYNGISDLFFGALVYYLNNGKWVQRHSWATVVAWLLGFCVPLAAVPLLSQSLRGLVIAGWPYHFYYWLGASFIGFFYGWFVPFAIMWWIRHRDIFYPRSMASMYLERSINIAIAYAIILLVCLIVTGFLTLLGEFSLATFTFIAIGSVVGMLPISLTFGLITLMLTRWREVQRLRLESIAAY